MDREPDLDDLVSLLSSGLGMRRLYFRNHQKVQAVAEQFTSHLHRLLDESGKEAFFVGLVDGKLVLAGRFLVGPTLLGRKLVDFVEALECGGILFRRGLEEEEILDLLDLAAERKDPGGLKEGRQMLEARGIRNVELSPPYEDAGWFGQFFFEGREEWGSEPTLEPDVESSMRTYQSLFDSAEGAHDRARSGEEIDVAGARTVSEALIDTARGDFTDILRLVRYPDYDTFTVGHSVRLALLAVLVGHRAGLPREFLAELGTAGLLHDVGKAHIPDEILFKPGRLDEEERRIINTHAPIGAQVLLESSDASPVAIGAAWGHHIRHDGGGYPARPPWAVLGKVTELIHVCDVYEALTAVRPYKPPVSPRRAYEIMLAEREAFDPGILTWFVRAMGIYPPGNVVNLTSGEMGLVLTAGVRVDQPTIRVTHDSLGLALPGPEQWLLDLSSPQAVDVRVSGIVPVSPAA